ncbi:HEAT repeat domain-containing protein [bacterium]|nr:HEAT repeat domain-containing protein [bacterium]
MIEFENVLSHPLTDALGWGLLHFIWQGVVVTGLLAGTMFILEEHTTNLRYSVALVTLLLMPALLAATTWHIWTSSREVVVYSPMVSPGEFPAGRETAESLSTDLLEKSIITKPSRLVMTANQLEFLLPWFVFAWLIGVLFFFLQFVFRWRHVQQLKQQGITSVVAHWQGRLEHLCEKMKVTRPTCLLESSLVQVPTVIGWLRPAILLSTNSLTRLTSCQLEAILSHELAHIRRYDYLFNILQTVVGTLLFYHPAVWWISNRIRIEREHCCDDLAVKVFGDTLTYARALTELEQLRHSPSQLVVGAKGGSLLHRIRRLINATATQPDYPVRRLVGVFVILTIFTAGVAAHLSGIPITMARRFTIPPKRETAMPEQNISTLIEILRSESETKRVQAAYALSQIKDKTAVPSLIEALGDKSEQVRQQAAYALGQIGDKVAVPALMEILRDESEQVRQQAADALDRINN